MARRNEASARVRCRGRRSPATGPTWVAPRGPRGVSEDPRPASRRSIEGQGGATFPRSARPLGSLRLAIYASLRFLSPQRTSSPGRRQECRRSLPPPHRLPSQGPASRRWGRRQECRRSLPPHRAARATDSSSAPGSTRSACRAASRNRPPSADCSIQQG